MESSSESQMARTETGSGVVIVSVLTKADLILIKAICHAQLCGPGLPPIFFCDITPQVCAFQGGVTRDRTLGRKSTVRVDG
jgi:hypothetical protein